MSSNENRPPSFFAILVKSWRRTQDSHWIYSYLPFYFAILCIIIPTFITSLLVNIDNNIDDSLVITSISAFMVLSGFLGGFSISAMTQIQTISSTYPFSSYLREEDLFDEFIFFPQFTISIQISAIAAQCASIIISLFSTKTFDIFILTFNIFLLFYVITKTWQLVDLIRVLTWHFEHYMRIYNETE